MIKGNVVQRVISVLFCILLLAGCSGYEAVESGKSTDGPDISKRQDTRSDYQSVEHLNRMGELAGQLRKLSSWNEEATVIHENLYIQALLFSTEVEASSCEELLNLNPHMPTGRYSLVVDGKRSSWNCEVRGDTILSSSPAEKPSTSGLCVFEGTCLSAPDSLISENFDSKTEGTAGHDTLVGTAGRDKIVGGDGNDQIRGGAGNDVLEGNIGSDELRGEAGEDVLLGGPGEDKLHGGGDNDLVKGGIGDDEIYGGPGHDYLQGNEGMDLIAGGDGNDYLQGGPDRDILTGQAGNDLLEGGPGHDDLHGGADTDHLYGGDGSDLMYGQGGADRLAGNKGKDRLHGGEGNDILFGNEDADLIDGGPGDDYMEGNDGDDVLFGGDGNDVLVGHAGYDLYVFTENFGIDAILGFEGGKDRIDIRTLGVNNLIDLRSRISCYGRWTGNVSTSNDYCVISFGSENKIAILESPGISNILGNIGNLDGIFRYKMSSEEKADREFLVRIYDKYFGRAPKIQAYYYWLEQMKLRPDLQIEKDILFGAGEEDQDYVLANTADTAIKFLVDNKFEIPDWLVDGSTDSISEINRIFRKYFDRDADEAGQNYWLLQSTNMSPQQLEAAIINGSQETDRATLAAYHSAEARQFLSSNGFEIKKWLSEAQEQIRKNTVSGWYQEYFGRTGEESGVNYWNGQMTIMKWELTERNFIYAAVNEDRQRILANENLKNAALAHLYQYNYDIPSWLAPEYTGPDKTRFIQSIYQKYFNRSADQAGIDFHLQALTNIGKEIQVEANIINGATGQDKAYMAGYRVTEARNFLTTNGFAVMSVLSEQSWTSRSDHTKAAYQKFFLRAPESEGLKYWSGQRAIMPWDKASAHMILAAHAEDRAILTASETRVNQARSVLDKFEFKIPEWLVYNPPAPAYTKADKTRFINSIYKKYFNRDADQEGINYHIQALTDASKEIQVEANIINGASGKDLARMAGYHSFAARTFLSSNNFPVKSVLTSSAWDSRSDHVKSVYQKFFLRTPDSGGLKYWNGQRAIMAWNKATADMILAAHADDRATLVKSETRVNQAKSVLNQNNYNIPSWLKYEAPTPSYTDADKAYYINSVYQKYFNRNADTAGMNHYRSQLTDKSKEIQVQSNILHGASGTDRNTLRTKNVLKALGWVHNNGQSLPSFLLDYRTINRMYRRYFGRDGGQEGLNYWVGEYQKRGLYKTVERDIIYNCGNSDRNILVNNTTYKQNAHSFLNKHGYDIPTWLK